MTRSILCEQYEPLQPSSGGETRTNLRHLRSPNGYEFCPLGKSADLRLALGNANEGFPLLQFICSNNLFKDR
ncbi:hypothetical protein CEXT_587761 [Caerostris extrusa]|uniref:Uncharacterized protein n=1 Tax=Caerostris extrusa TaxID=172846 RepID=A0AAV4PY36_CAEEX|nr:hypothetical protein CEXT_587761 [Caerostris extrusa]